MVNVEATGEKGVGGGGKMPVIQLNVGPSRAGQDKALRQYLDALPTSKAFVIDVKAFRRNRSNEQNRYLWGAVYRAIIDACDAPKPEADHLHEYWLGECFGWSVCDVMGWAKKVPMKRSSKLTTLEFQQFWQFIQRRCAETMGLHIPDPEHVDKNECDSDD